MARLEARLSSVERVITHALGLPEVAGTAAVSVVGHSRGGAQAAVLALTDCDNAPKKPTLHRCVIDLTILEVGSHIVSSAAFSGRVGCAVVLSANAADTLESLGSWAVAEAGRSGAMAGSYLHQKPAPSAPATPQSRPRHQHADAATWVCCSRGDLRERKGRARVDPARARAVGAGCGRKGEGPPLAGSTIAAASLLLPPCALLPLFLRLMR